MKKFKCGQAGCAESSEKEIFCPTHGQKMLEVTDVDADVQKILDRVKEVVEASVSEKLKDLNLDAAPGKGMFPKGIPNSKAEKYEHVKSIMSESDKRSLDAISDEKEKDRFMGKARIAYFFKHIVAFQATKDPEHLQHVKALAEGTDLVGGYLTPNEFRAELVRDIQDRPFLRNLVTVIPMNSDYLELPTLISDVKTSWGSENTAISTTTARFGQLTFVPKRLNTMLYTSRELVADSAINVVQLITRLFVEAIAREEDRVIVAGSGSGQPKGILQETLAGIDNANVDANLAPNVKKMPFRLGTAYRTGARWLVNSRAAEVLSSLQDSTGQFLLRTLEGKGLEAATLAGYPVHEQNDLPLDTLVFGNMSFYYLADREQISVETTTEGAGTFEKHQVAIKVVERIDGKVALTNAFRTLTNAGID